MFILEIAIIWLAISLAILTIVWLVVKVVRPLCPDWWERNIVGVDRNFTEYSPVPIRRKEK